MSIILGFDEVGRGPLAGPVVVACVLQNNEVKIPKDVVIRDSKKMTEKQKVKADEFIRANFQFGIGELSARQIDEIGIAKAVKKAAILALEELKGKVDLITHPVTTISETTPLYPPSLKASKGHSRGEEIKTYPAISLRDLAPLLLKGKIKIMIDGQDEWIVGAETIIRGDNKVKEISMASIVAKVYRDGLMRKMAEEYPDYGFEKHVGYGTLAHRQAILKYGLIEGIHRRNFCGKLIK